MTTDDPLGSLPEQDFDHDILLIAGSRPEVARLAPVATAFERADRIRAVTVATGADPMSVHEAFESLGVPADVTLLLREPPELHPAGIAATLTGRIDGLLVDLDPSAVLVYGGSMTAAVAAQVAFWRQIPVVHLQTGVASDEVLCPFPQEANRRIIGQLASLFLTTGASGPGSPIGPNAIPVGDTMAANPHAADLRFAHVVRRVRTGLSKLVLVGLDRGDSLGVLAGLPELLENDPDVELVVFGELATHGAAYPLMAGKRAVVVPSIPLAELVGLLSCATVLVSDDAELVGDSPGFGTPAVLVDGPHVAQPGDSIRSIGSPAVMTAVQQVLEESPFVRSEPSDGREAARVEQAVAWMFGMSSSPVITSPSAAGRTAAGPPPEHEQPGDDAGGEFSDEFDVPPVPPQRTGGGGADDVSDSPSHTDG